MYLPWEELESSIGITSLRIKDLWNYWTRNYRNELRSFRPKIRLSIEKDSYVIKTVESSWELESALKLRYDVFHQVTQGRSAEEGFDIDAFDLHCDHLVILETKTNRVIGTYRLNSTAYSRSFYSSQEFILDDLMRLPGRKLELGRACIHRDVNYEIVLTLLWKGIVQYSERVGAATLFGCASVKTIDPFAALKISASMDDEGYTLTDMNLKPRPAYRFPDWENFRTRYERTDPESLTKARKSLPPLLLSYLRMGARVGRQPALDRAFGCVDFMTVLDTQNVVASGYDQ